MRGSVWFCCILIFFGPQSLSILPISIQAQTVADVDADGNGRVDFSDFVLFSAAFESNQAEYDFSQNGIVDFADFVIFARFFDQEIQASNAAKFTSIALGTSGGLSEDNLTSFLLAPAGSNHFIALDAGVLLTGIRKGLSLGSFNDIQMDSSLTPEGWVLQNYVKAYLITHAHLDHVSGLVINSTDDIGKKNILGLDSTIDDIRDHLFNWQTWPNFGDAGKAPFLERYHYVRLDPGEEVAISGTSMTVEPHALSHSGVQSTAFLVQSEGFYTLFFGDTGPDTLEESDRLNAVWTRVAPLVRAEQLRGIFLEASFPNGHSDELLFGHLTPAWMMAELYRLAEQVDPENPEDALSGLTVVVTHIKPSFQQGPSPREKIAEQLSALNNLKINFIIPDQGQRITF